MTESAPTAATAATDYAELVRQRDALLAKTIELDTRLREADLAQRDHVIGLQAELQTALGAAATLRARVSELKDEVTRLRALLRDARVQVKKLTDANTKKAAELKAVRSSRAYRIGRKLAAPFSRSGR